MARRSKFMTDPNQRPPRRGKSQNGFDIPGKPRSNPCKGYYDSNGYFHPVTQSGADKSQADKPVIRNSGSYRQGPYGGGQQAAGSGGRQGTRSRSSSGRAASSGRTASPGSRKGRTSRKKHGAFFLLKVLFLAALALSAGLFWHYLNTNDWSFGLGTGETAAADASGTNPRPTSSAVFTGEVIPNAQAIVFSGDSTKPLYGKVIILDPGHGGTDSGCVYPNNDPEYTESDINLKIAESTQTALEEQGATVIMLRTDDSWISLYHRIALTHLNCMQYADEFGVDTISSTDRKRLISELCDTIRINSDTVDTGGMGIMVGTGVGSELNLLMNLEKDFTNILFLSIHTNSNPASSMHGTQIYYVTDDSVIASENRMVADDASYQDNSNFPIRDDYYGRNNARNELLAQSLYDSIISAAPQMKTNSQSVLADNYAVLRENNLAGALIEAGFITNSKDRGYLSDKSSITQISRGIAMGCVNFFSAGQ